MMSKTSSEINTDTNQEYAEIRIEECLNGELLDGWVKWPLEDVIHSIKIMKGKISNEKSE